MTMPKEVEEALNHVREFHPEITQVLYLRNGTWLFLDEDGEAPSFEGDDLDMAILETAFDMVDDQLPVIYALPEE